ncbi:hypothetical protein F2Q70_00040399 [Brassica cretica]|uniref:Uncharacterized protein n=1 Tax=Brassica cretica TaxID=69181 RepID=A0A8S9KAV8_BRACR|nr:hypothetical protein F2Q70_00040399 [Brassica cretica]
MDQRGEKNRELELIRIGTRAVLVLIESRADAVANGSLLRSGRERVCCRELDRLS